MIDAGSHVHVRARAARVPIIVASCGCLSRARRHAAACPRCSRRAVDAWLGRPDRPEPLGLRALAACSSASRRRRECRNADPLQRTRPLAAHEEAEQRHEAARERAEHGDDRDVACRRAVREREEADQAEYADRQGQRHDRAGRRGQVARAGERREQDRDGRQVADPDRWGALSKDSEPARPAPPRFGSRQLKTPSLVAGRGGRGRGERAAACDAALSAPYADTDTGSPRARRRRAARAPAPTHSASRCRACRESAAARA
ncbi:hypothetical protein X946_4805 [Burkholderia sp. ABCPW 111]|nr:hypothetical protein X946_4805 [Burkholderia sp. ABCPW 111]